MGIPDITACVVAEFCLRLPCTTQQQAMSIILQLVDHVLARSVIAWTVEHAIMRVCKACMEGGASATAAGRAFIHARIPALLSRSVGSDTTRPPALAWLPGYMHAEFNVNGLLDTLEAPMSPMWETLHGLHRALLMDTLNATRGTSTALTDAMQAVIADQQLARAFFSSLASGNRRRVLFALATLRRINQRISLQPLLEKEPFLLMAVRQHVELGPQLGDAACMPKKLTEKPVEWDELMQNGLAALVTGAERARGSLPMPDACSSAECHDSPAGGFGKLRPCLCMRELYCSTECQRKHWFAGHWKVCSWRTALKACGKWACKEVSK